MGHDERFLAGSSYPLNILAYLITIQPANNPRSNRFFHDAAGGDRQSSPDEALRDEQGPRRQQSTHKLTGSMAERAFGSPANLREAGS